MLMLIALMPVIISTSCSKEDDIEEIFLGKTFYISGATLGGKPLNEEVKELYANLDSYYIAFNESTFAGRLAPEVPISGRWHAEGKHRTMTMSFDAQDFSTSTTLTRQLADVLARATSYSGDANILIIKADDQNFVRLRTTKQ